MSAKDLRKLVIDTGIILNLPSDKIVALNVAINLAYNSGWLDRRSDIDLALENGASLDDLPVKL